MLSQKTSQSITISTRKVRESNLGLDTQLLFELGNNRGWELTVLGQAPYPLESVCFGDWMVVPTIQDESFIPREARERAEAITLAGIKPSGFVIAHELKPTVPALAPTADFHLPSLIKKPTIAASLGGALKLVGGGLGVVALGMVAVAGVVVVAAAVAVAAAIVVAPLMFFALARGIDPKLIAVMDDGTWVEVYQWDE